MLLALHPAGLGEEELLDAIDFSGFSEWTEEAGIDLRDLILRVASGDYDPSTGELERALADSFRKAIVPAKRIFLKILAIGAFSGIGGRFLSGRFPVVRLLSALTAAALLAGVFAEQIHCVRRVANAASGISDAALPAAEVLTAMTGRSHSSALLTPLAAVAAKLMGEGFSGIGIRMACFAAALSVFGSIGSYVRTDKLYKMIRKGTEWAVGLSLTLFLGALNINGLLGKSMDATAVQAARYAVDHAVPMVGGEMSDAMDSVILSAMHLKNALGVGCMLLVAASCAGPLLQLGMALLAIRLGAAAVEPVADGAVSAIADGIGGAVEMLLALAVAATVLSVLVLGQAMAAGGAVLG